MNTPTRRTFLGLAQNAVAAAAVGAIGVHFIEAAEAMPVAPDLQQAGTPPDLVTQVQWRRRRRRVCWWHRGCLSTAISSWVWPQYWLWRPDAA
jgi:hypothetical protein